jgi:hypothetical protein
MADKGKQPIKEGSTPPKKRTIRERVSCQSVSCSRLQCHGLPLFAFSSLDLLPEEIFGTEEVPEYILSDSSSEEEDATPERRINHQLRRRIRHLEHNLRDITARCNAERQRRMSLEALIGGKIFIFI